MTLGTENAVKSPVEGLSKGQLSTLKNRFYRAGRRLREQHPALRLRTRIADGYLCAWMEQ
jgi:hypothetical protein